MPKQYCASCGTAAMPTMRLCPVCGNKTFSPTQPVASAPAQTPLAPQGSAPPLPQGASPSALSGVVFQPAGHWARFLAYLIDYLIVTFFAAILGGIAGAVGVGNPSLGGSASGGVLLLAAAVVPFVYFTIMHSRPSGATWGKAAMGLRAVTVAGEKLTRIQAFVRCLLTLIVPLGGWILVGVTAAGTLTSDIEGIKNVGVMAIAIGLLVITFGPYLTVYFNPQRQTLFDMICKTCVIKN